MYNSGMKLDLENCMGKRVCVAFSGGGDSLALFHALFSAGVRLSAVNVEHGIRGESSRADSLFVREVCKKYGVPLYAFSEDVPALAAQWGMGLEEAARKVRYLCFLRVLREDRADVVATAHHALDNAESVLFHLFRGCSLTGAGGIRAFLPAEELAKRLTCESMPAGKGIVRPMLGVSKAEIEAYLREHSLTPRTDESNADTAYTRNFLRHHIVKPATLRFPQLENAMFHFSRTAREEDEYLYSLAKKRFAAGDACTFPASLPKPLLLRCAVLALRHFGVEKDYTLSNLEDVYALAQGNSGKSVCLPCGLCAAKEFGRIAVYPVGAGGCESIPFAEGEFSFGDFLVRIGRGKGENALYFDADKLPQNCLFRTRKEGDVFQKFGASPKKLKDFLIDRKIPCRLRDRLPVLACGSEVYAVCGAEISEKIRVDATSKNIFHILLIKKGEEHSCIRT